MKNIKSNNSKIPIWLYKLPIVVVTAVVPLILLINAYKIPEPVQKVMGHGPYMLELYHYYKMFFTVLMGILMLLILIYDISKDRKPFISFIKRNKYVYMIITLAAMLSISSIASNYKYIVVMGFPDRYEGLLSIMTYYVISFYIPYIFRKFDLSVSDILKYLMISGGVLSLIGILEYFGYRLVSQQWFASIARITLNPKLFNGDININFTFPPKTVAATLYNPNYVGSYMAMNIFATLAYISMNKHSKYNKLCYGMVLVFTVVLILSNSAAGLLGVMAGLLVLGVMYLLKIEKKRIVTVSVLLITILLAGIIIQEVSSPGIGIARSLITKYNDYDESQNYLYKDFSFSNNELNITYTDIKFTLKYDLNSQNLMFLNEAGTPLETYVVENTADIKFSDEKYKDFMFTLYDESTWGVLKVANLNIKLAFVEDGLALINSYGDAVYTYKDVKSIGFKGSERFATNRGYLWSRSLPILLDNLAMGIGPDCYAMEFPQDDMIGKVNFYPAQNVFVDKPHNLYLQTAINQGIISLVAFIVLMLIPIIKLIRDLSITAYKVQGYRILLVCCQISYLAAGLANDSTVSIGPVFWSIVGLNLYIMNKE